MNKKILIDWLTFSVGTEEFLDLQEGDEMLDALKFRDGHMLDRALAFLRISPDTPVTFQARSGLHGYLYQLYCGAGSAGDGGIRILWGGTGMDTVCFDLTGDGCRLMETLVPEHDWLDLIRRVQEFRRHNFSRMDIACDTFGELKMDFIIRYSREHRYISRWKLKPAVKQCREETVDFGSMKSRTMVRIYNKTLERQTRLGKDAVVPAGWVRCEMQLRDDAVDSFIREWQACGDVSVVYFGIMANQLRFVRERPEGETNLERLKTVAWWRRFLDNAVPLRLLYKGGLSYNLDSLQRYVFVQAGSSIRTWLELPGNTPDKLVDMVRERKLNERQKHLLELEAMLTGQHVPSK